MPEFTLGLIFNCNIRNDVLMITNITVSPYDKDYVEYDLTSLETGYITNATSFVLKWNFEHGNWSLPNSP
jgi:hypothetical protein